MSSYTDEFSDDEDFDNTDPNELYAVRDGLLFVVDATPPMFEKPEGENDSYFTQSIQLYEQILKQKLIWYRHDWMGLVLFGTNKCDPNSEMKNILTVQELSQVSEEHLKDIMKIREGKSEYGPDIASATSYPLHDVLWHAARAFIAIKSHTWLRRIIFITCQDDPPLTDEHEKHRIRVKAKSYNDISLQLFVVGLGNNWNHERFYKDLEIVSRKIDHEDYKRTSQQDLIVQVQFLSRNMAKLPFRLGEDVTLDVCIRTLCVKREYLKREPISKESNAPLYTHSTLCKESDLLERDEEHAEAPEPVLEDEIKMYQEFGDTKIYFSPDEVKSMCVVTKPGIDIICAKPKSVYPLYHIKAPYFVTNEKSHRKDNKLLFGALLHKCDAKNLMLVCAVTLKQISARRLCVMIPNVEKGGFYLYQLPFKENVRELADYFTDYIYDVEHHKPPTEPEAIDLFEKAIKKLQIKYDPQMFPNPKLQAQIQALETIALDLEQGDPPEDSTLPLEDLMREKVGPLLEQINNMFIEDMESPAKKKPRRETTDVSSFNDDKIRDLINNSMLENLTVSQLKDILKNVGAKTTGKKEELINRVKNHYS